MLARNSREGLDDRWRSNMCNMPKLLSEPITGLQNVVDLLKRHPIRPGSVPWSCPAPDQTHAELQNRVNLHDGFFCLTVSSSQRRATI